MRNWVHIERGVMMSQAKHCWGYIQVRSVAIFLGWDIKRTSPGWRFTVFMS